jgi:WD40 repeat protein
MNCPVQLICLVESSSVSTAVVADSSTIITGSMDGVLSFWTLSYGDKPTLELTQNLSGLGDVVFCTAVSKAWSVLLTGSKVRSLARCLT